MTPERYKKLTDWLEGHPALREGIILLNRWLPLVPFVCYPVLLVLLNLRWFTMLTIGRGGGALDFMQVIARAILVPGLAFGLGTILRARLNFPRPYEQPGFVPLVSKETHGNSCPSRHALSAAVLGMVWLYFYPAVGVVMLAIAALICLLRVLSGAHFVRDVLAERVGIFWSDLSDIDARGYIEARRNTYMYDAFTKAFPVDTDDNGGIALCLAACALAFCVLAGLKRRSMQ